MVKTIEKVTAFITRKSQDGYHLLLIEHPNAGIQLPAGTVEPAESPEEAVLREAFEETGLTISSVPRHLGSQEVQLPPDEAIILPPATVYTRPDKSSSDWTTIRGGVQIKVLRHAQSFTQITYIEYDMLPNPNYVTMRITGWVQDESLARIRRRHFFHLKFDGDTATRWTVSTDHHLFTLFWAPWKDLPPLISPQDTWLAYLSKFLEKEQ